MTRKFSSPHSQDHSSSFRERVLKCSSAIKSSHPDCRTKDSAFAIFCRNTRQSKKKASASRRKLLMLDHGTTTCKNNRNRRKVFSSRNQMETRECIRNSLEGSQYTPGTTKQAYKRHSEENKKFFLKNDEEKMFLSKLEISA